MNTRTSTFLLTAVLLSSPLLSHADSDAAMNACVKAFVSTSLEKERPVTVRKEEASYSPTDQHSRSYRISLKAVGKYSGQQVAKGSCIVNRNGVVISLNGKPVGSSTLAQNPEILSSR